MMHIHWLTPALPGAPFALAVLCTSTTLALAATNANHLPLPEHPRPDFHRADWQNLNGPWSFRFDQTNVGEKERWFEGKTHFPLTITVPFPWGSKLSGVDNEADLAWYARTIRVPEAWQGKRVTLILGACDWRTSAWLDGQPVGQHQGGYTPIEFDLTATAKPGQEQRLVLRVDDAPRSFKLEGKQGYGNARGIWQTAYLEARPDLYLQSLQFLPNIDQAKVQLKVTLNQAATTPSQLRVEFKTGDQPAFDLAWASGLSSASFDLPMAQAHLWSLDDPFLYEVDVIFNSGQAQDRVSTYFGLRKISVMNLPGTDFPYIALNNQPVYLQMALDQSYHPEGFYTYPSDAFMRDEILRSRQLGLNANRLHVKMDVPRKLYWADRLGLLLMCDVPNSWGQPDAEMRGEIESALRGMIQRDFNHPSIFAWVPFNETWGLFTPQEGKKVYLPGTQEWVASIYRLAKHLDPTRLVEDNSPCNYDHVETDINSWHAYLPGFEWKNHLDQITRDTFPGSKWNFIGGRTQGSQPLLNSECGNVWGYEGSTGDVDWSWDYHLMMNEFRRHPKVCGWLYTEHHDVINEWNGYYRYDRSQKFTGLDELVAGMTLRDLHGPFYISTGSELCRPVQPGEQITVPLWASFLTDRAPSAPLRLRAMLTGWNTLGQREYYGQTRHTINFQPWLSKDLEPLTLTLPSRRALALLTLILEDQTGAVLHRNFTTFLVNNTPSPRLETTELDGPKLRLIRFAPNTFTSAKWSIKQWNVLEGLKVNGAGYGYFEYRLPWPSDLDPALIQGASLRMEASAKQLFGKDKTGTAQQAGDFMRGLGTHDPSLNPNSYPMTDTIAFPSAVRLRVAGHALGQFDLPDDPADHRGILSWFAQKHDRKLREAGSYGYLIAATIPHDALLSAAKSKELVIRFEVDESLPGGLAIYGEQFGRYPLDPTLIFTLK